MGRPMGTLRERRAAANRRAALAGITTIEHLLALLVIEIKETRGHQRLTTHAEMLAGAGLSKAQAAAILGSSAASVRVLQRRQAASTRKRDAPCREDPMAQVGRE